MYVQVATHVEWDRPSVVGPRLEVTAATSTMSSEGPVPSEHLGPLLWALRIATPDVCPGDGCEHVRDLWPRQSDHTARWVHPEVSEATWSPAAGGYPRLEVIFLNRRPRDQLENQHVRQHGMHLQFDANAAPSAGQGQLVHPVLQVHSF